MLVKAPKFVLRFPHLDLRSNLFLNFIIQSEVVPLARHSIFLHLSPLRFALAPSFPLLSISALRLPISIRSGIEGSWNAMLSICVEIVLN